MKRFLVFAGSFSDLAGGWDDFYEECDSLDEARDEGEKALTGPGSHDWYHIVDLNAGHIVERNH